MRLARTNLSRIATVTVVVALAIFLITLVVTGTSLGEALKAAGRAGLTLTLTGAFWSWYVRWGWRTNGFRLGGWLSPYPDLNGRWEGTLVRHGESEPRPFVIEVKQTFTSLSFRTFSTRSRGASEVAFLTVDEDGSTFGAIAYWSTKTGKLDAPPGDSDRESFTGTSVWTLEYTDVPDSNRDLLRIVDNYFTSRNPATAGVISVERKSRKLRNAFE